MCPVLVCELHLPPRNPSGHRWQWWPSERISSSCGCCWEEPCHQWGARDPPHHRQSQAISQPHRDPPLDLIHGVILLDRWCAEKAWEEACPCCAWAHFMDIWYTYCLSAMLLNKHNFLVPVPVRNNNRPYIIVGYSQWHPRLYSYKGKKESLGHRWPQYFSYYNGCIAAAKYVFSNQVLSDFSLPVMLVLKLS